MISASPPSRIDARNWHTLDAVEVLRATTSSPQGLASDEAARRLALHGPNALAEGKPIQPLTILLGQFRSLIVWILIVAGMVSGILGEAVDAIAILAIVVLNAV